MKIVYSKKFCRSKIFILLKDLLPIYKLENSYATGHCGYIIFIIVFHTFPWKCYNSFTFILLREQFNSRKLLSWPMNTIYSLFISKINATYYTPDLRSHRIDIQDLAYSIRPVTRKDDIQVYRWNYIPVCIEN